MKLYSNVSAITYFVPERIVSNEEIAAYSSDWTAEKIEQKTGISQRHYVEDDEFASDLAVRAAEHLFSLEKCQRDEIDFVLLCTQTPDYLLPTTACLVQHRLGLKQSVGAMDINLGCSGYVYGLSVAEGLIASGQAENILFLTSDTYSKFLGEADLSVRTLFGDAASATLIQADMGRSRSSLGPFIFGTDGKGAENLIVRESATHALKLSAEKQTQASCLYMNGAEIFSFTLKAVPKLVKQLLAKAECSMEEVDMFVFHQANEYMLEHLRKKIKIPKDKFVVSMGNHGNTVSSSIPIALANAQSEEILQPGMKIMLVGFGVGYSWSATFLQWTY
jgi:3-oxoacyl-[acyl-carrier-protein] synthase-3